MTWHQQCLSSEVCEIWRSNRSQVNLLVYQLCHTFKTRNASVIHVKMGVDLSRDPQDVADDLVEYLNSSSPRLQTEALETVVEGITRAGKYKSFVSRITFDSSQILMLALTRQATTLIASSSRISFLSTHDRS